MSGCFSTSRPDTVSRPSSGTTTALVLLETIGTPGQEVGGEDRHGQLHELRRLDAQGPEADPAARPARHHTDAGHEHEPRGAPASRVATRPVAGASGRSGRERWRRRRRHRAPSTGPGARRWSTPTRSTAATCTPTPTGPSPDRWHTGPPPRRGRRYASRPCRGAGRRESGSGVARRRPPPASGGWRRGPPDGARSAMASDVAPGLTAMLLRPGP